MSQNKNIVLVMGKPNTGKSTSLMKLKNQGKMAYLNADLKELPFRSKFAVNVEIKDAYDVLDFIDEIEEEATFSLDEISNMDKRPTVVNQDLIRLKRQNWYIHLEQCDQLYRLMYEEGNVFYIPNKPDIRGRIYSQGHHINPMGNSYKKSSIDLYHHEKVVVPKGFFD